ncbi:MAG TPA: class I SAM-dependent methyltransferase [Candidatus Tectomicrobia bacterium]|nr:class I SAM-dependent methyltransferase [Candidatus Tectomicrobia bacterium]
MGIRAGIHILPVHYYSPVPNILELQETKSVWAKKSELPGVTIDLDEQSSNLTSICLPYQREYAGNQVYRQAITGQFGPGFGYIEAQALHGVLRCFKPARVIEVGSGASTWCTLAALEMNRRETGRAAQITCIEPYPSERLRALPQIALIARQVQSVPFQLFTQLGEGDLLFIDSSHMVKPGSDVNYLILEVVPRLQHGVMVHFHDIYLPYDYPPDTLQTFVHGTETSLLRAFLMFNNRVKILFCLSHLHYDRRDILAKVFPEYDPQSAVDGLRDGKYKPFENPRQHFPASIYVRIQG